MTGGVGLPWMLALVPVVYLLAVVWRLAVDVPFFDNWDLIPLLDKSISGRLSWHDLWQQHNEHRIVFPKLLMLALARVSRWNVLWEMAASLVFGIAILALLLWRVERTARESAVALRWLAPLLAWIVASVGPWENWLWGWQVQILINVCAATAGIVALSSASAPARRLLLGAACGVVATYSFASGAAFWVAGGLVVVCAADTASGRRRELAVWVAVTVVVMASYLHGYEVPPWHPSPWSFLSHPLEFAKHVLTYLGGPVAGFHGALAIAAGALGLAALAGLLVRADRPGLRAALPYVGLALYAVGSAAITGIGRTGMGSEQALASRYQSVAQLLWVAVVVCATLVLARATASGLRDRRARATGAAAVGLLVLVFVGVGATTVVGTRQAAERSRFLADCRTLLERYPRVAPQEAAVLATLHPSPSLLPSDVEMLRRHRLSVFRRVDREP